MKIQATHLDTAMILLDIEGFRILTDPVFDAPGRLYHFGFGSFSRKKSVPPKTVEQCEPIDLILLSHHQHDDNLDHSGKSLLARTKAVILSTPAAAKKLKHVTGLHPWQSQTFTAPSGLSLRVTATPSQHAPKFLVPLIGPSTGFILEAQHGTQSHVIYISGDTVFFQAIEEVGKRYSIDTVFLHIGAVSFPYLTGPFRYTMNTAEALQAARMLKAKRFIPIHYDGWTHFRENPAKARAFLESADSRFQFIEKGIPVEICIPDAVRRGSINLIR